MTFLRLRSRSRLPSILVVLSFHLGWPFAGSVIAATQSKPEQVIYDQLMTDRCTPLDGEKIYYHLVKQKPTLSDQVVDVFSMPLGFDSKTANIIFEFCLFEQTSDVSIELHQILAVDTSRIGTFGRQEPTKMVHILFDPNHDHAPKVMPAERYDFNNLGPRDYIKVVASASDLDGLNIESLLEHHTTSWNKDWTWPDGAGSPAKALKIRFLPMEASDGQSPSSPFRFDFKFKSANENFAISGQASWGQALLSFECQDILPGAKINSQTILIGELELVVNTCNKSTVGGLAGAWYSKISEVKIIDAAYGREVSLSGAQIDESVVLESDQHHHFSDLLMIKLDQLEIALGDLTSPRFHQDQIELPEDADRYHYAYIKRGSNQGAYYLQEYRLAF